MEVPMFRRSHFDLLRIASQARRLAQPFSKPNLHRAAHVMGPTLLALTFAGVSSGVAHAQGTMDFSSATTLMGTFKTFAIYAGAVICFGGLIFAGIRMMSGRFQLTAPNRGLQVANRDLGTLKSFDIGGQLTLRMDNGRDVSFDPREMRHFDHGYAVTSHSSQGLTSERVLVNMDTKVHPELINARFAYVSVSRASHDAQIFTNDASTLAESLGRDVSKTSALDFKKDLAQSQILQVDRSPNIKNEVSLGQALGL
jgi:hypothetical protein